MKDDDLKQRIKDEYGKITPNVKDKVLASCSVIEQESVAPEVKPKRVWLKRVAVLAACLVFFVCGAFAGFFFPVQVATAKAETFLYLDVNPSVEITLDVDNRVISVTAGNEDASFILSGLSLKNVELNTALNAIVGSMYIHGYLSEDSNSILVSVDSKHNENENGLLSYVTEKINKVFENSDLECFILAQSLDVDNDLRERAREQGVSVGKMHLVDKLQEIEELGNSNANDLASMSIKDLNLIYSSSDKDRNNDVVSGNINGYINKDDAIDLILDYLEIEKQDVEFVKIIARPTYGESMMEMKYNISVKKLSDTTVYNFEMDCKTGEITELATGEPNPNPNGGNEPFNPENPNPNGGGGSEQLPPEGQIPGGELPPSPENQDPIPLEIAD